MTEIYQHIVARNVKLSTWMDGWCVAAVAGGMGIYPDEDRQITTRGDHGFVPAPPASLRRVVRLRAARLRLVGCVVGRLADEEFAQPDKKGDKNEDKPSSAKSTKVRVQLI